tara:strand:- start:330 stop:1295 length:966 start_codon:yes stop_codon:yes gene_type:complete
VEKLKVLDLFSGIGGFSIGLERTGGFETVAFCEIDPFCQRVLAKHWPGVPIFDDVRKLNGQVLADTTGGATHKSQSKQDGRPAAKSHSVGDGNSFNRSTASANQSIGPIDVITGGYPCQPFSLAGKRRGAEDDRHLWPEAYRLVASVRPRWVIAENVPGHINMGLDEVLSDLEGEGYTTGTLIIPACAVDAPHRRSRLWVIGKRSAGDAANRNESGPQGRNSEKLRERTSERSVGAGSASVPDSDISRISPSGDDRGMGGQWESVEDSRDNDPCWWEPEPPVGRVAHGIPRRVDRLKGLGNAVVPQIPEIIGRAILEAERN